MAQHAPSRFVNIYAPNARKITQLLFAGLIATTAMTALAYLLPLMGAPSPDFGKIYGAFLNGQVPPNRFSFLWWIGFGWHLFSSLFILSILYDYLSDRLILPSERFGKGMLYGLSLWLLFESLAFTFSGDGFFAINTPSPLFLTITTWVVWSVYGIVLDGATRVRIVHEIWSHREKKAA